MHWSSISFLFYYYYYYYYYYYHRGVNTRLISTNSRVLGFLQNSSLNSFSNMDRSPKQQPKCHFWNTDWFLLPKMTTPSQKPSFWNTPFSFSLSLSLFLRLEPSPHSKNLPKSLSIKIVFPKRITLTYPFITSMLAPLSFLLHVYHGLNATTYHNLPIFLSHVDFSINRGLNLLPLTCLIFLSKNILFSS